MRLLTLVRGETLNLVAGACACNGSGARGGDLRGCLGERCVQCEHSGRLFLDRRETDWQHELCHGSGRLYVPYFENTHPVKAVLATLI